MGWVKPIRAGAEHGLSRSAIIGAGPAGLAAADGLRGARLSGHGLRPARPRRRPADLRHPRLQAGEGRGRAARAPAGRGRRGVRAWTSRSAATPALEELRARHDAVLIATGVYKARELTAPGAGSEGVVAALDYLIASNKTGLGDAVAEFAVRRTERRGQGRGGASAAATPPWTACARPCARARARSPAFIAATSANMPGSHARSGQRRGGRRAASSGWPRPVDPGRRRPASPACAPCACGWARPTPPGRQAPEEIAGLGVRHPRRNW